MKFSTREDIDAPIERVFDALSDFEHFERLAMRQGVEVQRVDRLTAPAPGMTWDTSFKFRGKRRDVRLTLQTYQPPSEIHVALRSKNIDGSFTLDFIAMSKTRTRVNVAIDVKPLTFGARLVLQSMKLAKNSLTKRFKLRTAEYFKALEDRLNATDHA